MWVNFPAIFPVMSLKTVKVRTPSPVLLFQCGVHKTTQETQSYIKAIFGENQISYICRALNGKVIVKLFHTNKYLTCSVCAVNLLLLKKLTTRTIFVNFYDFFQALFYGLQY